MRVIHPGRGAEKAPFGAMLAWGLVFLLGITLIFGHVKYYDLTLQIQDDRQELSELRQEQKERNQKELQWQQNLIPQARHLGMYLPQPEEYQIIHVE